MSERTARGYMLQSILAYVERRYDAPTREKILERVDPRVRAVLRDVNKVAWYPVGDVAELFRAIAHHHKDTDGRVRESLVDVGRAIGEAATNTFLKLVLKILTPSVFASKMPGFWERDHRCGSLSAVNFDADQAKMEVLLAGVKDYDFIGPVAPGFVLYALESLGLSDVKVDYAWSLDDPGPESVRYTFTWRK